MTPLGQPLPHDSAGEHVRGTAVYLDDLPPRRGELVVDFVGSPVAHGKINAIDLIAARSVDGVVAVLTAADVAENSTGPVFHDEEVLASGTVRYVGQPVVAVAGTSRAAVEAAKKVIRVDVDSLPPVLTIEDAIAAKSFIGPTRRIARGDAVAALAAAEHRLSGEFSIGGQEHFYLEAQAALAVPGEGGAVVVHSSTQNPTEIQSVVARALGIPLSLVVCECRRMGGGFGGKETQAAMPAILAALVASKTGRPARCVFGHEQDFRVTGKRHPYSVRYEVGFAGDGRITALTAEFYSNGGFSADLSLAVMERSLLHGENAYFIPHVEFTGTVCRTNLPSNTAFRGFGGPQGVAAMENVVEEIAAHLGLDPYAVRRRNLYGTDANNVTPYGQIVRHNRLPEIMDRLVETTDYHRRREDVLAFNAGSRTHLRGLALTPVKFGISFTRRTLNQGNALVNVYLDGSVQVSTGGTEMGQGLFVKLQQLVAGRLGIAPTRVRVMTTSTEKNNNTSPTAASTGTDLNGAAAVRACDELRGRLAVVAARHFVTDGLEASPDHVEFADGYAFDRRDPGRRIAFPKLVQDAYEKRVDLGARGFFATPGVDFNRETGRGTPFRYFTYGAAVSEVLIDRFTGELRVERADILMDLGRLINPAVDRGQVVGAFVQGMGWVTTESLVYGQDGKLWSDSATTYKIPHVTDVPADIRVDFLGGPVDPDVLCYGNKAVGEPPLLLGLSVWAAVKQALASAAPGRRPTLDLPATGEEVLRRLTELTDGAGEPEHHLDGADDVRPPVAPVPATAVV
jgi:xanthine dehydrogenase large subunit